METIVDVEYDTICDDAVFNHPDVRATKLQNLNVTGIYRDTLKSVTDCDSVIELHLQVWDTYEVVQRDTICDNEELEYESTIYKDLAARDEPYQYDVLLHSVHGCDSLVHFYLKVWPTYSFSQDTIVCQDRNNINWEWTDEFGGVHKLESSISIATVGAQHLVDNLSTQYGCDSTFEINITVVPSYYFFDTLTICEDDTIHWQDSVIAGSKYSGDYALELRDTKPHGEYDYSINYGTTIYGCDSIYSLHLIIHPAYLTVDATDTTIVHICDNEVYHFKTGNEDDVYNVNGEWARSDKAVESHLLTGTDTTVYGCDSVIAHIVYIHPTYDSITCDTACLVKDGTFEWVGHMNNPRGLYDVKNSQWVTEIPIGVADDYIYIDSMKTITCTDCRNGKGCDSIWTLHLSVRQTYYYYDTLAICENDTVHWQDSVVAGSKYSGDYALELRDTKPHGEYDYSINYGTTIYGCDSIYNLHLIIHPAYLIVDATDTTIVHICDNETYRFKTAQVDTIYNSKIKDWITGDKSIGRHVLIGWDTTRFGCDSAVAHVVYVHPTYEYRQEFTVCQDTINTVWDWVDEFGNPHEVPISLYRSGDYTYADTLKTTTCTDCRNGEGCDSVFYVNIHIPPIYRFDSVYIICENERLTWQGRSYAGDSAQTDAGDRVLPVGVYYDTAYYKTWEGCDSIYYMQVIVHPVYDTTTYVTICDNEDFVWEQTDHLGMYSDLIWKNHVDTVYLGTVEALLPQPTKETKTRYSDRLLRTIHDCDSLSRLWLTIKPSYLFITDTAICTNDRLRWRGKNYAASDTIIEEKFATADGCDSIYQLHLHTMPSYVFPRYREICDNDTLFHTNSSHVIWAPGQLIPNPDDCQGLLYQTVFGCDSLYCYYITVHPTYFFDDTIDLCTGESYVFHDTHNILFDTIYEIGQFIPATDTIIKDTLSTTHGCDSVYWLYATIYPTYRHIDEYTICDNDSLIWRDWCYKGISLDANGLSSGSYTYYDSLLTQNGCDSVYVLKLHVNPTYFYELHEEMCDDESYNFNGRIISGIAGDYFFTDSLLSVSGCDSVYHLYLTIHPSTHEVLYDTLCAGESYDFHEKLLYQDGYYIDTTLNEWGCRHVTELYLTVEDPTSVQVDWVSEICDDEKVMEIHYSYDGRMPISFSVLFDDFGHSQGFMDIIKEPVKEEGIIRINIPYGEPLPNPIYNPQFLVTSIDTFRYVDTTHLDYPRPGIYPISIYLQNGVCADDRIRVDTIFEMLFPAWIHEQHWNDAIVLFNEKYNGGYHFVNYQWYCDWDSIPGEVQGYLYDPQLLKFGSKYCVKLDYDSIKGVPIRGSAFTCPITPTMMGDTIVPTKPYVAVVPTCLPLYLDGVDILCTEEGLHSYSIQSLVGQAVCYNTKFKIDNTRQVHHISIPNVPETWYIITITTQSGYVRTVKVFRGCDLK